MPLFGKRPETLCEHFPLRGFNRHLFPFCIKRLPPHGDKVADIGRRHEQIEHSLAELVFRQKNLERAPAACDVNKHGAAVLAFGQYSSLDAYRTPALGEFFKTRPYDGYGRA